MDVEFGVLNEVYTFEDCESFNLEQLPSGKWEVTVDGDVKGVFEFMPSNLSVTQ